VLSSASDRYIEETTSYLLDPHTGETAKTAPEKARLWEEALERTVDRVLGANVAVSVIHPMPRFGLWEARECAYITLVVRGEACSTAEAKPAALAFRERAIGAERAVAARRKVQTVDLFDALCPGDVCRTSTDGRWRNLDSFHITVEQSVALAPQLAEAVTPHP
jgi:lysophospholipase L1-like esterase